MELLLLRPLVWGIIEYILAFIVYKRGNFERTAAALFIFFLGTYQIGEAIMQLTGYDMLGLKIAYAATTMLPPFGFYFLNKITGKPINYSVPFLIASVFAMLFLLIPEPVTFVNNINCIAKVITAEGQSLFGNLWAAYYVFGIVSGIILAFFLLFTDISKQARSGLLHLLAAYAVFYPVAFLIIFTMEGFELAHAASLMCALAIISAVIMAKYSLFYPEKSDTSGLTKGE